MLKKFFLNLILIFLGLAIPLLGYEGMIRAKHYFFQSVPFSEHPKAKWDTELGWPGKEHVIGAPTNNPGALVLGDSFTEGLTVPTHQLWFSSLRKVVQGKSIIAYGGLGYGTLQELLVLKRYLREGLQPDLIVVQLCSNDFLNNYAPLEELSYLQRAPGPRPFLERDKMITRFPRPYGEWLLPLLSYSRMVYRYNNKLDTKLAERASKRELPLIETEIQQKGRLLKEFDAAYSVTQGLIKMLKDEAGKIPLVFMVVDDIEPYSHSFREIARGYNIPVLIPSRRTPLTDSSRLPDGAHLNEHGNKLIGDSFVSLGIEKGIFTPPTD